MRPGESKLADLLTSEADAILRRWRTRLDGEVVASLDDHVAELLRELADALRCGEVPAEIRAGKEHRRQHARHAADVNRMMREYALLRTAVFDLVEEHEHSLTTRDARVLADFVSQLTTEAMAAHGAKQSLGELALTAQLASSEAQLRVVTDALSVLISFVTVDFRYGFVNKAYEEWFGRPREELVGRPVVQTIGEAALVVMKPHLERAFAGERLVFEQRGVPYRDAGTRDVQVELVPHHNAQGEIDGCVALLEDVTERVRLADESARLARERTADLERRAQFEQQLIGIVSHDLRNPLNVIGLAGQLLALDEQMGKDSLQFVVRIRNAADRATRLVRDLLDFTQARLGGGIHLERSPADLHELVRQAAEEVAATFPLRQVDIRTFGDAAGEWDGDRVQQVVQNLVANALKYSPDGSVVTVTTSDAGEQLLIEVRNGGATIPVDKIETLFEPFQRASRDVDKASRSVGLGLYIVKHVVEAHGGEVAVRSTDGEGTLFTVRLPRRPAA